MTTSLSTWASELSIEELQKEYVVLRELVEVLECFNAKDFSRLLVVENELGRREAGKGEL